jgi:outer membrane protein
MYKNTIIILLLTSNIIASTISFNNAYDKTIKNNKSLKAKKIELSKAQLDLKNANSYNYGTLTFNENIAKTNSALNVFGMKLMSREADFGDFGFSDFLSPLGIAISGAANRNQPGDMSSLLDVQPNDLNNPGSRTNFETKLSYDVPLFTGYKLENAKKMSKLQIKAQNAKYNYDKKQLGLEVLKAYNGAVAAKYFIEATNEAKKATVSFVNFASEMHKEGYVTNIDVKQAKVYDMKINSLMIESKNKYSLAIEYLKFLTSDYTITDVGGFVTINTQNTNNDISLRDDYQWMSANTATMQKKIAFEKSVLYPVIGAHLEYGFNDNELNNLKSSKDYYVGAIGLEYKIFNGFKSSSDIQKAKLEYMKTKHYLDYMKEGIALQVKKAKLNLQTKESILKEKRKALILASEVLEQSNEMYKNQLLKMSDLLLQEANHQKAKADVIKARYDLSIAAANLQLATGNNIKGEK